MAEITVQSEQSKAVQTTIHIYLPLFTPAVTRFRLKLLRAKDWHPVVLDTCFYLRYVDQIFCAKGKNQQSLLTVNCLVMQNDAVERTFLVQGHTVALTAARL
jgi:hypothetical protein